MNETIDDTDPYDGDWPTQAAFGRIRLSTLILFRWLAVGGQLLTVLTVHYALGYPLPITALLTVISASALSLIHI